MATQTLAMPAAPWPDKWSHRYVLEGRTYWFDVTYNDRDGFWYLAVGGSDRSTQVQGLTLNIGTDKLRPYKYADVPPGRLDVVDANGGFVEPGLDDMGSRVVLRYTDSEELELESRELNPVIGEEQG